MRRAIPTSWQYLLDNLSTSKLNEAYNSGDETKINEAEAKFRNLSEDECTFEKPYRHPAKPGKFLTTMRCTKRNFMIDRLSFTPTPVFYMIDPAAKIMNDQVSLDGTSTPALYYVENTTRWHLVVKKETNLHEALKMTGWEFKPEEYQTTLFDIRNEELKADGYIDIIGPIVQGRLYLTYASAALQAQSFAATTTEANVSENIEKTQEAAVLGTGVEVKGTEQVADGVAEGTKLETNLTEAGEKLEVAPEEVKDDIPQTENRATVNQAKQNNQFKQNKNKR